MMDNLIMILTGLGTGLVYGLLHWLTKYYRDGRPIRIPYLATTVLLGGAIGAISVLTEGVVPGQVGIETQLLAMAGVIGVSDPIMNAFLDKKPVTVQRIINILLRNNVQDSSPEEVNEDYDERHSEEKESANETENNSEDNNEQAGREATTYVLRS